HAEPLALSEHIIAQASFFARWQVGKKSYTILHFWPASEIFPTYRVNIAFISLLATGRYTLSHEQIL
ncbi:hypothetical protein ACIF8Z_19745, partial [Pseudomonas promysalinigenes]|uniref:hypothetical protein n=1 Tax=Pseudomonas promysalinigenes TaxID=485898 RepID=UPI0037C602A8